MRLVIQNDHFSPSVKLDSRQNYYFSPSTKKCFGFRQLSSSIYHTVDYRYFEHRAISNKSFKNMKRQRMREKKFLFLFRC